MHYSSVPSVLATFFATAYACESCEHPERDVVLTRNIRRMQPDAIHAISKPRGPLAWGQLNFMHTSDTHGWLVRTSLFYLSCDILTGIVGRSPERTELRCRLGRLRHIRRRNARESEATSSRPITRRHWRPPRRHWFERCDRTQRRGKQPAVRKD